MMGKFVASSGLLLYAGVFLVVGGCSPLEVSAVRVDRMVPSNLSTANRHAERINVVVTGDAPADYLVLFNQAITQCIKDTQVFAIDEQFATAPLVLEVTVLRMLSPGYSTNSVSPVCTLVTKWSLKKSASRAVVFERDIVTSNTHDAPDYMIGGMRTAKRDATEAASADNVKRGIEWLAKGELP